MAADGFLFSHNTHDGSHFFARAHTPVLYIHITYHEYNDFITYLMCYIDANLFILYNDVFYYYSWIIWIEVPHKRGFTFL